ncbi:MULTISPECIES: VOC family protein [unclassified Micromonospora]|uniref:VOC family protein n=1 Tax=unclassified Micromonospora TaxID=2617518 RepID=UPI00332B4A1F
MTEPRLDHLVYAVPDLAAGVAGFAARTGVTPVPGGRHPGGTANYLVGFGPTSYLEIIGPDPEADPAVRPRTFGLDVLTEPRLTTWAVRPDDIEKTVGLARVRGYDPGEIQPLSRRRPDGVLLSWRLTRREEPAAGGLVPFLIDWGGTEHPARSGLPQLRLTAFTVTHPDPSVVRRDLAALDVELDVTAGPRAALEAVLDTPRGSVALR